MLGKQWAALRGLYNADVDFLYTALGVYAPQHLGVVQFYGAAAEARTEKAAADKALRRMAAVEATLANYPLSRLSQPNVGRVQLLIERMERLPKVLAVLGHPDPRMARRGLGRDGALGEMDDELASQQGEILLRGLSKLSEDFVFLVTAAHIGRPDLTEALVKMSQVASQYASRQRGAAFVGDTGYGKSVAAERMVYETTRQWKLRTIVLDFGAGWRKLLNAPGLEGRVEIRQLSPGGVRPLRWNPLQIGHNILPEVQWRSFCDIFGAIAKLGVRRQVAELREALRRVYLGAGVLVDDPDCRADNKWGHVRGDEVHLVDAAAQMALADLSTDARQRLAVERSRSVGLSHLFDDIERKLASVPPRDSMLRGVLEGILFRLHPLVQGAAAAQYAAGEDAVDLNEIVPDEGGVAVLEGGAFLDDFSKAVLLGWSAWHLYTDAVIVRIRHGVTEEARIQIIFEEANKILAGLDSGGGDDEGSGASTAEQFASMWRDSRKSLHLITQSPSLIPPGILSSCNNILVNQVKNPRDRDLVIASMHRSEKGFVDEGWRRFLASLPIARAVAKFGYSFDRAELEPCYIEPLRLDVKEPSDEEILERLG